jgi:hypothetical protein
VIKSLHEGGAGAIGAGNAAAAAPTRPAARPAASSLMGPPPVPLFNANSGGDPVQAEPSCPTAWKAAWFQPSNL